jgi:sulfate permease, SulP family
VIGLVDGDDPPRWLILVADGVDDVDFTGDKTLLELAGQLERRGVVFAIAEASPKVRRELDRFGVTSRIGREHVYATLDDALAGFHRAGESGPRVAEPV